MLKHKIPDGVLNVIFDLDGTIIDSSDSILSSLKHAFEATGTKPLIELNSGLIGPPLNELITISTGLSTNTLKFTLVKLSFEQHYDSVGYLKTKLFPGVKGQVEDLFSKGINIWLATNKRKEPTFKILKYFGLLHYVKKVYTLDSFIPALSSKLELLQMLIANENLLVEQCVFIGDRQSDQIAASRMNMNYIMVPWGYESNTIIN
jgi:phosphoglycolate phosphatase